MSDRVLVTGAHEPADFDSGGFVVRAGHLGGPPLSAVHRRIRAASALNRGSNRDEGRGRRAMVGVDVANPLSGGDRDGQVVGDQGGHVGGRDTRVAELLRGGGRSVRRTGPGALY